MASEDALLMGGMVDYSSATPSVPERQLSDVATEGFRRVVDAGSSARDYVFGGADVVGEPGLSRDLRSSVLRDIGEDPIGSAKKAGDWADEQLMGAFRGDAEAARNSADMASFVDQSGISDALSAAASARLAYERPSEELGGHLFDVGISGLAAGIPLVGSGFLKQVLKGAPEPVFESVLEKAVLESMPAKIGVDDVEQFLNKKGAKKSEIADTKVSEFVSAAKAEGKKSVTKDELIKHLDDNKVQIEEVRLGGEVPIPQEIRDLGVKRLEAARSLDSQSQELAKILAPGENLGTHRHKFEQNPTHFKNLYADYINGLNKIRDSYNVPDDVGDITSRVINLGRDSSISDWTPKDAALITEARTTVNAKLDEIVSEPGYFAHNDSDQVINLKMIGMILNKMPEAESRLAALRKFENLPKYQEYSSLHRQHQNEIRASHTGVEAQRARWEGYVVPGGENYQEILLTVPTKRYTELPEGFEVLDVADVFKNENVRGHYQVFRTADIAAGQPAGVGGRHLLGTPEDAKQFALDEMNEADDWVDLPRRQKFTESHFSGIPNVMAHIRFKTRIDSKGRRILFVEEIQSDWHQKGLKQGYKGGSKIPDFIEREIQVLESAQKAIDDWKKANPKPPNFERGFEVRQEAKSKYDILQFMDNFDEWKSSLSKEDLDAYEAWRSWTIKAKVGPGKGPDGVIIDGELTQLENAYNRRAEDVAEAIRSETDGRTSAIGGELRATAGGPAIPIKRIRNHVIEQIERNNVRLVPDAPLKDTKEWTALAIKRIFREAADGGYDGVAFTRADMITPVVTLPAGEAFDLIGNPEAFLGYLADLKKQGGSYAEGAEEAEKVFKGNQYFYDKLIPSIAKKETKAKQSTTAFEMTDELDQTFTTTFEVPFFELTKEVKDKVIKPQKLYSLALPGIAIGAAAAEEEELSAAAAIGAIGMGGMALYRGAKGAKAARAADLKVPAETTAYEGQQKVGKVLFDSKDGMGAVPNSENVAYRGFVAWMKPRDFLGLNPVRSAEHAADTVKAVAKAIEEGKPIGPPFLSVNLVKEGENAGSFQVIQHEGRGRMAAINELDPDTPVPVHVFGRGAIDRGRDITAEMMQGLVDPGSKVRFLPDKKVAGGKEVTPDAAWHVPDSDDYDPNYLPIGKTYRAAGRAADAAKPPAAATDVATAAAMTDTPEFKTWSGGLPIVKASDDIPEGGAIVEAYHGTASDFDAFDQPFNWVSTDTDTANRYARFQSGQRASLDAPKPQSVMPLYARVEAPFDADRLSETTTTHSFVAQVLKQSPKGIDRLRGDKDKILAIRKRIIDGAKKNSRADSFERFELWHESPYIFGEDGAKAIKELLEAAGFDSVKVTERGATTYGVLNPTQLKSKFNKGTFDPTDPRILWGAGLGAAGAAKASKLEDETGNPLGGDYVPVKQDMVDYAADFEEVVAESAEIPELELQSEMIIAEYGSLSDEDKSGRRGGILVEWFDDVSARLSSAAHAESEGEYERFLMDSGSASSDDGLGFEAEEMVQRENFSETVSAGSPLVDLYGASGKLNRWLSSKARHQGSPVSSSQVTTSDRLGLRSDPQNIERLKRSGLITYLLYRDLLGDTNGTQ